MSIPSRTALVAVALLCALVADAAPNRTMKAPVRYRIEADPGWSDRLFTGDFNRDGRQDVLTAGGDKARVFRGQGNGLFEAALTTTIAGRPFGIADFNGDGNRDLYTSSSSAPFAVYAGLGNGLFAAPSSPAGTSDAKVAVAGDFNGDTFLDVACAYASGSLVVYFGNGAGAFTAGATTPFTLTGQLSDLETGDFDLSGRLDLFLLGAEQSLVAWNGGSGTFAEQSPLATNGMQAACGDINGDGAADLVASYGLHSAARATQVWFGAAGTHALSLAASFEVPADNGSSRGAVALAQLDGIGGLDVVLGNRGITVIRHDTTNFRTTRFYATEDAMAVAAADFTGDSAADVVTVQLDVGFNFFAMTRGNGDGTLDADPVFPIDLLKAIGSEVAAVSDVNADGRLDLIVTTSTAIATYHGNPINVGGFATPVLTNATLAGMETSAADLNADGRIDLLAYAASGGFQPYLLSANGTFTAGTFVSSAPVKVVADLTGDGRTDVFSTSGRLYAGLGNGTFGTPSLTGVVSPVENAVHAVDLNRDGLLDIGTVEFTDNYSRATLHAHLNLGGGTFAAPRSTPKTNGIRGFADVDGDGYPELFSYGVYRGHGDGTFTHAGFGLPVAGWDSSWSPRAGDFDGDGKQDIASGGTIFFGTASAITYFDGAARTPKYGDTFSIADFDGNGSPDVWKRRDHHVSVSRTRLAPAGDHPAAVMLDMGTNPSTYGHQIYTKLSVAAGALVEARGATILRLDSGVPHFTLLETTGQMTHILHAPTGTSAVTLTFPGDAHYGPSAVATTHTVQKATPAMTFVAPDEVEKGTPVSLCVDLDPTVYGDFPTGTIDIRRNGTFVATVTPTLAHCQDTVSVNDLTVGDHIFTAEYSGDANYLATSKSRTVKVTKFRAAMTIADPGPVFHMQETTLTVDFPEDPGVTGTVTFQWGGVTHAVPIANARATWTPTFPWGDGTLRVDYSGSADYEPASATRQLTVYSSSMPAAPVALSSIVDLGSPFQITLRIPPIHGAQKYEIRRMLDSGAFVPRATLWAVHGLPVFSESVATGRSVAYVVIALDAAGNATPQSARVVHGTFRFADTSLPGTNARAQHFLQLQTAINGYRTVSGLAPVTFPAMTTGTTISASHLTALRNAIAEARAALGRPVTFDDPTLTPGVTRIRAVHVEQLRDAVR
jgi:Bacterial Ig-like domain (group 3)/FG-GAP-like repeat